MVICLSLDFRTDDEDERKGIEFVSVTGPFLLTWQYSISLSFSEWSDNVLMVVVVVMVVFIVGLSI